MNIIKLKRIISLFLISSAISGAFGCGANTIQPMTKLTEIGSSETTEEVTSVLSPNLPSYDGGGKTFTVLAKMEGTIDGRWTATDVYVEDLNGEIVNDAVYNRNIELENKYNIEIKAEYMAMGNQNSYTMCKEISKLVMAGDQTYDIVMPTIQDGAALARDGMLYDLSEIGNIDLSKPWWSSQFNKDVNIGGKSYYANGDISMTFIRASYCVLFNKGIISDYSM